MNQAVAFRRVTELLGGKATFKGTVQEPLQAHDILQSGLPGSALVHLMDTLTVLPRTTSLEKGMGMSLRTFQRTETSSRTLSPEQSGRAWKFAEILAQATAIFGTQADAEKWLEEPALGLDRRRPIDLLSTPAGVEMVESFLGRLEYGVYT